MDWVTGVLALILYAPIYGFILIGAMAFLNSLYDFARMFLVSLDAAIASLAAAVMNSARVAAKSDSSRSCFVFICDFIDDPPDWWDRFLLYVDILEQTLLRYAGLAIGK